MDADLKALLDRLLEINKQIAENTRPPGIFRRILEYIGLIVTIAGVYGLIQQIIGG